MFHPRKYNTAKNLNMIMQSKTGSPPSRIPNVSTTSGEYCDQDTYSRSIECNETYSYETNLDKHYYYDEDGYNLEDKICSDGHSSQTDNNIANDIANATDRVNDAQENGRKTRTLNSKSESDIHNCK